MLKLLRLATLYFEPIPTAWRAWEVTYGAVVAKTLGSWEIEGKLRLLVASEIELSQHPDLAEDRVIIIPTEPRRLAERAIEMATNTIAVTERCRRWISSPNPYIGFSYDNEESLDWLNTTSGLLRLGQADFDISAPVRLELDVLADALSDREPGIDLLSEALAHGHATGKFHELVRFFEAAFTKSSTKLVKPLSEFLYSGFGDYTEDEVHNWLVNIRHPATHADKAKRYLLEGDVARFIPRIEQAAYDVMFNKATWRSSDFARRSVWSPIAIIGSDPLSFTIVKSHTPTLFSRLYDEFHSYPLDLSADLSGNLSSLPSNWWFKYVQVPDKNML